MEKTLGELCDELSIENIRIWMAEDVKRDPKATDKQIADACRITNKANQRRSNLIQAIDKIQGIDSGRGDQKTYGKK